MGIRDSARGDYVDAVGKNEKRIKEYIQQQLWEDKLSDQISMKEYIDPFTGCLLYTSLFFRAEINQNFMNLC